MKAAIFRKTKNIIVEEYPIRKLNPNEVLIKVENCGICRTDIHIYEGKAHSARPVILGHEFAGIVADNNNLKDIRIDDKIVVDPNIYCGRCDYCREGKPHLCRNLEALGVTQNGGLSEYTIVPISQIHRISKIINLEVAAFTEPLSCCLRGIELANILPGHTVIIIGGGSIGQIILQLAKISGASKVILIEPDKKKRTLALNYGASVCFDPFDSTFIEKIKEETKDRSHVIIECVGKKDSVDLALRLTSKGSRIVIFGLCDKKDNIDVNLQELFLKEVSINFSYLNPFKFVNAIELLETHRVKVNHLISEKISLSDAENAFEKIRNSHFLKYQIINSKKEVA